jgi:hypothetical protein
MIARQHRLTDMKKTGWMSWSAVVDLLVATACVALISNWERNRARRRRREAKLDTSLADTFPASDPLAY